MQLENISDIVLTHGIGDEVLLSHPVLRLPVAIYTCDANGYIRMFNRAAADLWGREPEPGKEVWCGSWKLFHPDGRPFPLDECPMAAVLKNGFVIPNQEIIIQRPDGSRRTVIPHPKAIMNEQGRIIGAVNMLVDITSRKNAEEDSARLTAIQSSEDAVISKTLQGIVQLEPRRKSSLVILMK
jgi:PAS domain S-box-containing protein